MDEASKTTRRGLLKIGGGAVLAARLSPLEAVLAADDVPAPGKKLGWAVVGVGRLTSNQILPALVKCKNARLAAVVSGDIDKAKATCKRYGVADASRHSYTYENYDDIKNDETVDVVYVVLPNSMHAEYTIRAAKAGKHVFCEKPMANSIEECRQMIDACKAAGKRLGIAYRMQYEPHQLKAIALLRADNAEGIGRPKIITADHGFNIGPNEWRTDIKLAGGGPLVDVGIYCLNAARYLTGEEPVEVSAIEDRPTDDPRFKTVEASMTFMLKFPSGALASCTTSYACNNGSRLRVMAERGEIVMEPAFGYSPPQMVVRGGHSQPVPMQLVPVDQFATEMDEFSKSVQEDRDCRTPGEEGSRDMRIIEALYQSAREGRSVKVTA
jgi:predicted dehydrogenase